MNKGSHIFYVIEEVAHANAQNAPLEWSTPRFNRSHAEAVEEDLLVGYPVISICADTCWLWTELYLAPWTGVMLAIQILHAYVIFTLMNMYEPVTSSLSVYAIM